MDHIKSDLLWSYISGELLEKDYNEVKTHLNSCSNCSKDYQIIFELHKNLGEIQHHTPSMRFSRNVTDYIQKSQRLDKQNAFWLIFTKRAIVIAIGLAIFIAFYQVTIIDVTIKYFDLEVKDFSSPTLVMLSTSVILWILYGIDRSLNFYLKINRGSGYDINTL